MLRPIRINKLMQLSGYELCAKLELDKHNPNDRVWFSVGSKLDNATTEELETELSKRKEISAWNKFNEARQVLYDLGIDVTVTVKSLDTLTDYEEGE